MTSSEKSPRSPKSSKSRKRFNLYRILLSVSLFVVLVEGVFLVREHILEISTQDYFSIYRPNPHQTGSFYLKPDISFATQIEGMPVSFSTNSQGWSGPERNRAKQEGKKRVAFLGDSFVMGLWTNDEHKNLAETSGEMLGPDYEVLNFGVGGYGLWDSRKLLEEEVLDWQVDEVVLVIFPGNDFDDAGRGLMDSTAFLRERSLGQKLAENSAAARFLAGLVHQREITALHQESPFVSFPDFENGPGRLQMFREDWWDTPDLYQSPSANRNLLLDEIFSFRMICEAENVGLRVVLLPFFEQVYTEQVFGAGWTLDRPGMPIRNYCRNDQIPCLDLLPGLRMEARNPDEPKGGSEHYFRREGHLTPHGHEAAGKIIGQWLKDEFEAQKMEQEEGEEGEEEDPQTDFEPDSF